MNLKDITPLILTYDEAPNIRRCLEQLTWAERIVVMDSGSDDSTMDVCAEFPNVEVIIRPFDSFAGQCNAGLGEIETEWVLSIDADYIVPVAFREWAESLTAAHEGYRFPFRYCVFGKRLRSCLYPPRAVFYLKGCANYQDDGHGHRVTISGQVQDVPIPIDHDDRKPLSRWFESQKKYAVLEAEKLEQEENTEGLPDRVRKMIWPAAPLTFVYTLIVKRTILDGWAGWFYAFQRTYAELLLSLILLEKKITSKAPE